MPRPTFWTPERLADLRRLRERCRLSYGQCAQALGTSRNAIAGACDRYHIGGPTHDTVPVAWRSVAEGFHAGLRGAEIARQYHLPLGTAYSYLSKLRRGWEYPRHRA